VVNVGAGAGSYEPADGLVIAAEPSSEMLAQRAAGAAPAVRAVAEHLPLAGGSVDAALAVLTMHGWPDWRRGAAEMVRVARLRRIGVCVRLDGARGASNRAMRNSMAASVTGLTPDT